MRLMDGHAKTSNVVTLAVHDGLPGMLSQAWCPTAQDCADITADAAPALAPDSAAQSPAQAAAALVPIADVARTTEDGQSCALPTVLSVRGRCAPSNLLMSCTIPEYALPHAPLALLPDICLPRVLWLAQALLSLQGCILCIHRTRTLLVRHAQGEIWADCPSVNGSEWCPVASGVWLHCANANGAAYGVATPSFVQHMAPAPSAHALLLHCGAPAEAACKPCICFCKCTAGALSWPWSGKVP